MHAARAGAPLIALPPARKPEELFFHATAITTIHNIIILCANTYTRVLSRLNDLFGKKKKKNNWLQPRGIRFIVRQYRDDKRQLR